MKSIKFLKIFNRHYYGANLHPNDKDNKMRFELLTIDSITNEGRRTSYMSNLKKNLNFHLGNTIL